MYKKRVARWPLIKAFIILIIIILKGLPVLSDTTDPGDFLKASHYYKNKEYEKAATLYKDLIFTRGIKNGGLYYNLGNCYVRMGEIGYALLYYRIAERYMPRDEDLKYNINYVIDQRKDKIEIKDKGMLLSPLFFWYHYFNLKELGYIFISINCVLGIICIVMLYKKNDFIHWLRLVTLFFVLLFFISFSVKAYSQYYIKKGVVVSPEINVRSGKGSHNSVLFKLHKAAECRILNKEDEWIKIKLSDNKLGWVDKNVMGIVY
ncbi:MAG: tetratricopeptide repeat protein [bacterium]